MATYTGQAAIEAQLITQGVTESEVLSRFLADFPEVEDSCEYPDLLGGVAIDAGRAWWEFERLIHGKSGGVDTAERGDEDNWA